MVGVDLHVHTALSPCASNDMAPPAILLAAERAQVAVLGVVDHATCGNAWAMWGAAPAFEVRVLCGLEVESSEGVHLLALFEGEDEAREMNARVAAHLAVGLNRPEVLGDQLLLDEWGDPAGVEPRLLIAGTDLDLDELVDLAKGLGGISIPAHIDRTAYGLLGVLGFLPPDLGPDLYEVTTQVMPSGARRRWPELVGLPLVTGSDAHVLGDIGVGAVRLPRDLALADGSLREWVEAVGEYLVTPSR